MQKTKFQRPELVELINRISQDHNSRVTGLSGAVLRRSALGIIARSEAGAVNLLHGHLDWIANQIIIDTAEGEWLERWAAIWKIYRKPAAFAAGSENDATGINGKTIPVDSILVRSDGFEYKVTEEAEISSGTANISLIAVVSDTDDLSGNCDAGTVLTFQTPLDGINSSVTVAGQGISGGAPIEDDDGLRDRLLFRIQNPPRGGALHDYVAWALEYPGVTRAWAYAHYTGIGKVGFTFMMDNSDPVIPTNDSINAVKAYIETVRPATVKTLVGFAPAFLSIDMTIKLDSNDAATKAAVDAEIDDYFSRWEKPGNPVIEENLDEAISIAAGEVRHLIVSTTPAFSSHEIALANNELPKRGTITYTSYT